MPNDQWLDPLSETIRSRALGLMDAHGLTRADVGEAIGRGSSWMSEFCRGERGTDDLRLVLALARVLKVPVGYLLGLEGKRTSPKVMGLQGLFESLPEDSQDIVLLLAQRLHQREHPSGR